MHVGQIIVVSILTEPLVPPENRPGKINKDDYIEIEDSLYFISFSLLKPQCFEKCFLFE